MQIPKSESKKFSILCTFKRLQIRAQDLKTRQEYKADL
jgi:hypothetical protein